MTTIDRRTSETQVRISTVANAEDTIFDTGIPFLDHMLRTLARYAGIPLVIQARGDLGHHVVEDVAISLGEWMAASAPGAAARFADRTIVMDDALVQCALDTGDRAYYEGPLPSRLYDHWMRSFATSARCSLHISVLRGRDRHHVVEAAFKALGLCLRDARAVGAHLDGVFSTKGAVVLRKS